MRNSNTLQGERRDARQGATLLEVLVAIFVMGIGLLALLVLFPLGALRMAQAIRDDRIAQAARNASNLANMWGIRSDSWVVDLASDVSPYLPLGTTGPVKDVFKDPIWTQPPLPAPQYLPADPDGPSFPVLVDPAGYINATGLPSQTWLTNSGNTIRRRTVGFIQGPNRNELALRWFTLLDDLFYDVDGTARNPVASSVEREIRYTCAYMLKRPRTSNTSVVDLTVLVFDRRTLGLSSNLDLNETLYQTTEVAFDPVRNTITLDPTSNPLPNARAGDWLLDASYIPDPTGKYATVNGYFYRIVGLNEVSPTAMEYEVQPELRNFPATGGANTTKKVIFMEGLAEVFEKGPGRTP